jgi:hypothetical protein
MAERCSMSGLEIAGIVIAALILLGLIVNARDIVRYIHISTM